MERGDISIFPVLWHGSRSNRVLKEGGKRYIKVGNLPKEHSHVPHQYPVATPLGGMGGQCPGAPELKRAPRERERDKKKKKKEKRKRKWRKEKIFLKSAPFSRARVKLVGRVSWSYATFDLYLWTGPWQLLRWRGNCRHFSCRPKASIITLHIQWSAPAKGGLPASY